MTSTYFVRLACFAASAALILSSQTAPREQPRFLPDGSFLLNSGWRVKPAGTQVKLDTLPMASVLTPGGKFMIVLNAGYNSPSLSVMDTASGQEIGRTPVPDAWLGLAISPDGRRVWVGGGSKATVYEFSVSAAGELKQTREIAVAEAGKRTHVDFLGDVAVSPDGNTLLAADLFHDSVIKLTTSPLRIVSRFKTGRRPYRILFHPDGRSFFVTSWADATLYHHQTEDGSRLGTQRVGQHPTDMVWRDKKVVPGQEDEGDWKARIFVSAANTNNVYAVGVSESKDLKLVETINVATTPMHPLGMTPTALALSPDQNRMYVVCSDANAAAVVDVSEGRSHVLGFVPTGWYPTGARALADGRLVILNGKGGQSYANPKGPNPMVKPAPSHEGARRADEYVGSIQTGSASIIAPFDDEKLFAYTKQVLADSPYSDAKLEDAGATLPAGLTHVLYIVKENRTYDQVLGDMGKGESDPSLCIFPENVTPNHHKLAREFVHLDNFYVNGDVSGDGHNWTTAAIASDYVQKFWPNSYAGRRKHYDYEGGEPAATPPAGYIWTNVLAKGISMRNYGYFVNMKEGRDRAAERQVESLRDSALNAVTNMNFPAFDLEFPDVRRAEIFLKDLKEFEAKGDMPQFSILRLGNDHTSGTAGGKIAPQSAVADNDYALGMIVEGLSRSKFWKNTAIFVVEDDAQNGPDHIDSHRSPGFVLSPYTRRGVLDSTMYNTTSMLRTMEMILGLRPMTHFDAGARPMAGVFAKEPVMAPYVVEKPRIRLDLVNPGKPEVAKLDLDDADRNDDQVMNNMLWRAIKGTDAPAPVRSFFSR